MMDLINSLGVTAWKLNLVIWGLVIMLAGLLYGFYPLIKGWRGERHVRRALRAAGLEAMHDIVLDGNKGPKQIDHVVRLPDRLLAIETKFIRGKLFGKAREETWTQCLGRAKIKIPNPLRQCYGARMTLHENLPDCRIGELVIIASDARFPKGEPENVVCFRDLPSHLRRLSDGAKDCSRAEAAWSRLKEIARRDGSSKLRHLKSLHKRHGGGWREPFYRAVIILGGFLFSLGLMLFFL
jgi:hypothetical protein